MFRLDRNDIGYVNPDKYCEEWAAGEDQQSWFKKRLASWVSPCPCSLAQIQGDGRFVKGERITLSLANFNEPGE